MKKFVFRNATIEAFFPRGETMFSGYGDISEVPPNAEIFRWEYTFPPDIEPHEARAFAEDFLQKLRLAAQRVPAEKPLELVQIAAPTCAPLVLADTRVSEAADFYNTELKNFSRERGNSPVLDAPAFDVDWRLWFLAQMPFSPAKKRAFPPSAPRVPAVRKKCLVLDCDDTLWGGVLGEDGFSGIALGGDFPGNAFAFFQKKCVALAESGIVLAVSSKNNYNDVREVFEKHPAMILRPEHISAWRVNWKDKAENLREIAEELNIGEDAIVFVDNDARERERIVHAFGGSVAAPAFPKNPAALPDFFEMLADEFFRTETLTREDSAKTRQYRDAAARTAFAKKFSSLDDYVGSLEIRLHIAPADDFSFPRLAQLTQKTNQFNLATRRRTEAELRDFCARGNAVFSLAATDKFGDLGIVGEAEISFSDEEKSATLENFMMSCRALGRGIETAFAQKILNALRERGIEKIFAEFIATPKNAPCADFLPNLGFSRIAGTRFALDLQTRAPFAISRSFCIR